MERDDRRPTGGRWRDVLPGLGAIFGAAAALLVAVTMSLEPIVFAGLLVAGAAAGVVLGAVVRGLTDGATDT